MSKRKIAVFTGNRAEYGLQFPILKSLESNSNLEYKLIVSGAHLDSDYGDTLSEIKKDGFKISAEIRMNKYEDTRTSTAQAIGSAICSISNALLLVEPDVLLVYADRFEGFAAVIAATQMNIPTAHIEGGDLTEGGALDDSVRHAMTKLSHLHFTTNLESTNRVLGMGEEPWRVHTVGLPMIDLISEKNFATPEEIVSALRINLDEPIVLFTQHSVTTEFKSSSSQIRSSIEALNDLAVKGMQIVITYPNNDAGSQAIIDALVKLRDRSISGIHITPSLGRYLYHGMLALAKDSQNKIVCVGNSSSGIKETPAFGCPAVNIGSRQKGRLRAKNVIDVGYNKDEIVGAVVYCINDEKFRKECREVDNPYYMGGAGKRISEVLSSIPLDERLIKKSMTLKGESVDGWFR